MDPITIGMALMKFAPTIAGWLFKGNDDKASEDVTDKVVKVVKIAQELTGKGDENEAIEALANDKELAIKFQQAVASFELEYLREENKRIDSVNRTMQAEAKSEKWPQYSWRPFNGYLFGITLFSNFILLPLLGKGVQNIPEIVFVMWGAVLGVTAWHRGAQKREQAGGGKSGLGSIVDRTLR